MSEVCSHCKHASMRRSARHGFAERFLYSLAGYYPWRCTFCKQREMLRNRGEHEPHRSLRPRPVQH